jgi:hypothetical protein
MNTLAKTIGGAALTLALFGGMSAVAAAQALYPSTYGTPSTASSATMTSTHTSSAAGTSSTNGTGMTGTGSNSSVTSSNGSTTPGVPNTGAGGDAATNIALLGTSAVIAVLGAGFLARRLA